MTESRSTLDGAPALVLGYYCEGRSHYAYAITALHGGRGYFFIAVTAQTVSHAADRRALEVERRSFRWR